MGGGGAGRVAEGLGGTLVGEGRDTVGVGEASAAAAIASGAGPPVRVGRGCTGVVFSSATAAGAAVTGGAAVTTRIGVGVGGGATACATGTGVGVTSLATILLVEWQPGPVTSAAVVRRVTAIRFLMAISISRLAARSSRPTVRGGNRFSTLDRGRAPGFNRPYASLSG